MANISFCTPTSLIHNVLIFVLLCLLSCEKDKNSYYSFEKENEYHPETFAFKIRNLDSLYGKSICLIDSFIVIRTSYGESLFHLINLKKQEYLGGFGDELILKSRNPLCFCQSFTSEKKNNLPVFIDESKKIHLFSIPDKTYAGSIDAPDIFIPKSYFLIEKGRRLIGSQGAEGSMFNYEFKNSKINWVYDRPEMDFKFSVDVANIVYTNKSAINEKNKILAIAYYLFNQVDIFSYDGKLIRSISFKDNSRRKPIINETGMPLPDTKVHYLNIKSVNNNLYMYYSGKTFEKNFDKSLTTSEIHVVNLKGEAREIIKIDGRVIDYAITSDEAHLFALIVTDEASNLIKINLKK